MDSDRRSNAPSAWGFGAVAWSRAAALACALVSMTVVAGCTPEIGDRCSLSTDCSIRGDRLCDTAQPGGYCTIFNCRPNTCPNDGACVFFRPAVPGCGINDRVPSRSGRSFCMAQCEKDADCRAGYVCSDPTGAPWNASILDDEQNRRVCIVLAPSAQSVTPSPDAGVCQASGPPVPPIDAGRREPTDAGDSIEGGADAAADAPVDAGSTVDGGGDGQASDDGGSDAGAEAG